MQESESSILSEDISFPRQQGGGKTGKLARSSISTKRSEKACSIPSKYSTTLFDKSRISGFGSTEQRFTYSSCTLYCTRH